VIWIHDISQTALAGAVLSLALVIMLELRSIVRLRRLVDGHLARVFEQLDLLRYENQQLLEARSPSPPPAFPVRQASADASAPPPATPPKPPYEVPVRGPLAAGEARLLASLAAARARRELPDAAATRSQPAR
jgi:hypothetical protein